MAPASARARENAALCNWGAYSERARERRGAARRGGMDAGDEEDERQPWRRCWRGWRQRFSDDFVLRVTTSEESSKTPPPPPPPPPTTLCLRQAPGGASTAAATAEAARHRGAAGARADVFQDPGATGTTLWDSALVLAHWLMREPELVRRRRCIELGAGIGLNAAVAHCLGAEAVVATGLPPVLPLLEQNMQRATSAADAQQRRAGAPRRRGQPGTAALLEWGNADDVDRLVRTHGAFDAVLCSDLIYCEGAVRPLIATLRRLLRANPAAVVYLAQEEHRPEPLQQFFELLEECLDVRDVPSTRVDGRVKSRQIRVVECRRVRRASERADVLQK